MKLAILSDVHGNYAALTAVADHIARWQPDQTIVNGDLIGAGPRNAACWTFAQRQAGWRLLRGNHEEYVSAWADPSLPTSGPRYDISRPSRWAYHQLGGDVAALAALPDRYERRAPDGAHLFATHASAQGSRAGFYPTTAVAEMRRKLAPWPAVFVTSHTHLPFLRQVDATLLVNTGSVGLVGDGDHRASYAQLTWRHGRGWQARIARVRYDWRQTERDYFTTGYLAEAGPCAALTLVELRSARDAVLRWTQRYQQAVLDGRIGATESVRSFLNAPEFRPYLTGIPLTA